MKKKFHFKNRDGEIGGDFCIAHSIKLREKRYTVFANGDAMGKSLQGAGGSLVFGVAFNAYVNRTKISNTSQNTYPEKWLENCFDELQSIFTSFDGSMLVSVIIGMIDDETGYTYYFNAEHPWVVLYRNQETQFIERKLENRKIGVTEQNKKLEIHTMRLLPKDTLILGSDGKDDIIVGFNEESGKKIINEDETLFLKYIKEHNGNLNGIVAAIKNHGEITDDLSLLKIVYTPTHFIEEKSIPEDFFKSKEKAEDFLKNNNFNQAIEHYMDAIHIYEEEKCFSQLAYCFKEKKDYEEEAEVLEKAIWLFPWNLDFVFRAAIVHKKLKNYNLAVDYGEKFYYYHSNNLNNIINLVDIYRLMKNIKKAKELLLQAEKLNSSNKNVLKLKGILEFLQ